MVQGDGARALVLLSGGIDSAVALWWARQRYGSVAALTIDYHLRPEREQRATEALAAAASVRLVSVNLPFLREAGDLPDHLALNRDLQRAPGGYVPARNLIFYGLAAYHAEALDATAIVGGHHGADPQTFPDASVAFFDALADLVRQGLWSAAGRRIEILLPLAKKTKEEALRLGTDLGVPFDLTWSCYWDGEHVCGACASCVERAGAFATSGVDDPLGLA